MEDHINECEQYLQTEQRLFPPGLSPRRDASDEKAEWTPRSDATQRYPDVGITDPAQISVNVHLDNNDSKKTLAKTNLSSSKSVSETYSSKAKFAKTNRHARRGQSSAWAQSMDRTVRDQIVNRLLEERRLRKEMEASDGASAPAMGLGRVPVLDPQHAEPPERLSDDATEAIIASLTKKVKLTSAQNE